MKAARHKRGIASVFFLGIRQFKLRRLATRQIVRKKRASSFSPAEWHDNICNLGETPAYDQSGYDSYVTMVHRVRLSMAILVGLISIVLTVIGIGVLCDGDIDDKAGGVACIVIAIALVLLIIVPVYTAL